MKRTSYLLSITVLLVVGLSGCTGMQRASQTANAVAVLSPTQGNDSHGTVYFTRVKDGVRIDGEITSLKPGSPVPGSVDLLNSTNFPFRRGYRPPLPVRKNLQCNACSLGKQSCREEVLHFGPI